MDKIYIHNEIFDELKVLHGNSGHVAFAYTYYYLICWLYRYAKYGEMNVDVKMIKGMLGYNAGNKKVDYLIKKDGVLDQIGLTYTSKNYPVVWTYDGELEFTMFSELDEDIKQFVRKGSNYKIKVPVKALCRNEGEGTFYDISNTHEMSYELFEQCMKSELGCSGFYLCGYLKYKCDKHGEYCTSLDRLAADTGMSKSTLHRYLGKLVDHRLISYRENSCKLVDGEFQKLGNTYKVIF